MTRQLIDQDWLSSLPQLLRSKLERMSLRGPAPITGASGTNRLDSTRFDKLVSGDLSGDLLDDLD